MIRIVLVDDHKLILTGLQEMLKPQTSIIVLATFTHPQEAIRYIIKNEVDIVLTDLEMPEVSGIALIGKIRRAKPSQKIIVLSMIDEASIINRMIKYDVNGYLMKNDVQEELIPAIEKVHMGEIYYNQDVRELLFRNKTKVAENRTKQIPKLSMREKDVLSLIIAECTTTQIAERLFISEGTVITHRKHILSKLGVKNTAGMVRKALQLGLVSDI